MGKNIQEGQGIYQQKAVMKMSGMESLSFLQNKVNYSGSIFLLLLVETMYLIYKSNNPSWQRDNWTSSI